jgi:hypothetical protein
MKRGALGSDLKLAVLQHGESQVVVKASTAIIDSLARNSFRALVRNLLLNMSETRVHSLAGEDTMNLFKSQRSKTIRSFKLSLSSSIWCHGHVGT